MDETITKRIHQWGKDLDGVFALSDLQILLGDRSEAALFKRINALVEAGLLGKVKRGLYATPDASLAMISYRIDPSAYVSTGTVLARAAVIGSVPAHRVQAVKIGRPRKYQCAQGVIEHLSISPKLYFGFLPEDGCLIATPEKAFLDVCYYAYLGRRFSFDPATDVNREDLNEERLFDYLARYDKRFVRYVRALWVKR